MFSEDGIGLFGVRMRGEDNLLGFCGFVRFEGMKEPELAYELKQVAWGKGFATEACVACPRQALRRAWNSSISTVSRRSSFAQAKISPRGRKSLLYTASAYLSVIPATKSTVSVMGSGSLGTRSFPCSR